MRLRERLRRAWRWASLSDERDAIREADHEFATGYQFPPGFWFVADRYAPMPRNLPQNGRFIDMWPVQWSSVLLPPGAYLTGHRTLVFPHPITELQNWLIVHDVGECRLGWEDVSKTTRWIASAFVNGPTSLILSDSPPFHVFEPVRKYTP